jgi:hypothetical protein
VEGLDSDGDQTRDHLWAGMARLRSVAAPTAAHAADLARPAEDPAARAGTGLARHIG